MQLSESDKIQELVSVMKLKLDSCQRLGNDLDVEEAYFCLESVVELAIDTLEAL